MTAYTIAVHPSGLSGNPENYVLEGLDSVGISAKGRFIAMFANGCVNFVRVNSPIGVCNGAVSLRLILVTLGIGSGDKVIVPTLTSAAGLACMSLN